MNINIYIDVYIIIINEINNIKVFVIIINKKKNLNNIDVYAILLIIYFIFLIN